MMGDLLLSLSCFGTESLALCGAKPRGIHWERVEYAPAKGSDRT